MPVDRRSLWKDCYSGEHTRDKSPEAFRYLFCSVCRNVACTESVSSKTRWQARMDTQEDRLLVNPEFADQNDPRFTEIRQRDFPDLLRKAMQLEISSQRGDWEPITATDAAVYATELASPSGYMPPEEGEEELEPDPQLPRTIIREIPVRGSGGRIYRVMLLEVEGEQGWVCSCPAFEYGRGGLEGCKHIRQIMADEQPQEPQETPTTPAPTHMPPVKPDPEKWQQASERGRIPKTKNTSFPSKGLMIDGTTGPQNPEPTTPDPWVVPEKTIPVGGKVILGGKKE